jgi:hypothetical protein
MSNSAQITPEYQPTLDWLLASTEPWVVYNTLHDLVSAPPENPEVQAAYHATTPLYRHYARGRTAMACKAP